MKVISLFDGMACGLTALKRAGIKVSEYHAFEVDKYAISIAMKNHPEIIQHGSVVGFDFSIFKGVDLLIGGSPCQGFSLAGKQLAFNDPRSKLFFEFVRAKEEMQPKYFLLENVKMKKEYLDAITELMGVEPILINSALVSAQNRNRYYWCNWKNEQPADKGIYLKDIIEHGAVDREKSLVVTTRVAGATADRYLNKSMHQMVFICSQRGRNIVDGKRQDYLGAPTIQRIEPNFSGKSNCLTSVQKDNILAAELQTETKNAPDKIGNIGSGNHQSNRVYSINGKSVTLSAGGGGGGAKTGLYEINYNLRKLTPIECERLQTLPDDYTLGVSNNQRYKMLGNGWTVDVIVHLFKRN